MQKMHISNYKNIISFSIKALLHKSIIKTSVISLLCSLVLLIIFLYSFWNAIPSLPWLKVIFWGVFDNLLKGAAGQAMQNFNLMNEFNETTALTNNANIL